MNEAAQSLAERAAQREEAAALRREHVTGLWKSVKDSDPFSEHHYCRMFSMEILLNGADDLHPRAGSFLGQSAVDRNSFSGRQKQWLVSLLEKHLGIAEPVEQQKSKKIRGQEIEPT